MAVEFKDDNLDRIAIQKIIQIIESRTDLVPAEYVESRKFWLGKILVDKELTKELYRLYAQYLGAEAAIKEFVLSVNKNP